MLLSIMKIRANEIKFERFVLILFSEKTKGNKIPTVHAKYISHWPNHSHLFLYFNFT